LYRVYLSIELGRSDATRYDADMVRMGLPYYARGVLRDCTRGERC
jgi:hypothetical protein